jgi:hypothetical protein
VVRICGLLQLHVLERRILAWRLIKMAVNANIFHVSSPFARQCVRTIP